MKKHLFLGALLTGALLAARPATTFAQTAPAAASTGKNLAASAALSPNHSTLLKALEASGLAKSAEGTTAYTVFAPDNAAFAKLPAGTVDNLLKPANKKKLAELLAYHVVPGSVLSSQLKDGQVLKTVQGESLKVSVQGGAVTLTDAKGGKATVTTPDIQTTNGVVHSIDTVLMPAK